MDGKVSVLSVSLNILNGMLAGTVVVLLRSTMLQCHGKMIAQVTVLKMLIGAATLLPICLAIEGSAILSLTSKQLAWLWISSGAILIYHVNLSLLCWLATAPTVAIVEALRPVPAFIAIALLQKMEPKNANFWVGSVLVLVSAVGFQLSRRFCKVNESRDVINSTTLMRDRKKQRSSGSTEITSGLTEITSLLDGATDSPPLGV